MRQASTPPSASTTSKEAAGCSQNMQEHPVLTVYREILPRSTSYRAVVKYKESIQHCIARPFNDVDEASGIYKILNHPNLLCPLGLWTCCRNGMSLDEVKIKAFITFPTFDGALVDLPREEIFIVEDNSTPKVSAYGFTRQGSKMFCDLVNLMEYINGHYANPNAEISLCPIKINPGRVVYKKIAEGKYHVYMWADFFNDLPMHKRRKSSSGKHKDPTADDIRSANWDSIGTYLKNLWQVSKVTPNEEIKHLATVMTNAKMSLDYTKLTWEPALWCTDTKIHFIREVFWCTDNKIERKIKLKSMDSLGLKDCITKLGFTDKEENLFDSIMFLRKKVVAHMDSLYNYSGAKDEMGRHKKEIEIKIQKSKPDYMISLVKEMCMLNWIPTSPLLRSSTRYIEPFRCATN